MFLSWAYRSNLLQMLLMLFVLFNGLGLLLAGLLTAARCAPSNATSFATTFVLSVGQFVSFGEEGSPRVDDAPGCIYLTVTSSILALLLQACIFALTTSKVLNPVSAMCLPTRLCCVARNGEYYLSMRIAHPQGHYCSHIKIDMIWVASIVTAEGKNIAQNFRVPYLYEPPSLDYPFNLLMPLEGSPFEQYAADVQKVPGRFKFTFTAFDEVHCCACAHRGPLTAQLDLCTPVFR